MQLIYCCSYKGKPLLCRDCDNYFNMSKRVKGRKLCPADYDDADQSDSDNNEHPDYIFEEPTTPKISQTKYKKRQLEKPKNSTATPNSTQGGQTSSLQANRDRINARSQVEEDDESTRPPRPYKRKSPSIVWKHCTKTITRRYNRKSPSIVWKLAQRESIKN